LETKTICITEEKLEKLGCRYAGIGEYGFVYAGDELPSDWADIPNSSVKNIVYHAELSKLVVLSEGELLQALEDGRAKKLNFYIPAGLLLNVKEYANLRTLFFAHLPLGYVKRRYFYTFSFLIRCCLAFRDVSIPPVVRSLFVKPRVDGVGRNIVRRFPTIEALREEIRKAVVYSTRWRDGRRKRKFARRKKEAEVQKQFSIYMPTAFYERFIRVCRILRLSYGEVIAFLLTHIECLDDLEDAIAIIAQHESRYYKQLHPEASEEEVLLETARLAQIKFPPREERASPFFDFCQDEEKAEGWRKLIKRVMNLLWANMEWFERPLRIDKSQTIVRVPIYDEFGYWIYLTAYDFYEKILFSKGKIKRLTMHEEVKIAVAKTVAILGLKGGVRKMKRRKAASAQPALTVSASNEKEVVKSNNSQVGAQPHLSEGVEEAFTLLDNSNGGVGQPVGDDVTFANATPPPPELRYLHFEPDGSYKILPLQEGEKYKNIALEKWGRYLFGYYILVGIFRSYYLLSKETDGIDDSSIERRCPYCNSPFATIEPPKGVRGEFPPPGVFFCETCPAAFIVYQPHKDKIASAYWQPPSNKARLIPIEDYLKMARPRALWDEGEEKAEVDDYDESVWRATHEKLMPVVEKFKEFVRNNRRHIRREIVNAWNTGAIWGIANLTVSLIAEVEPSFKSKVSAETAKLLSLNVAGYRFDNSEFELNYALTLTIPHLLGIVLLDGEDGEEFLKKTPRLIGLMLGVTIRDYKPYTNYNLSQLIEALNKHRGIFLPPNLYRFNLVDDPDGRQFYITVEKVGSKTQELVAVGFAPGVFKFYGELDDGFYYFVMENGAEFVIKDYVPRWLKVLEPQAFALLVAREAARIIMRYESVGVA